MANVQIRFPHNPATNQKLERVPSKGDYIASQTALFHVEAVVFTPAGGAIDAIVFVTQDQDGKPDEIAGLVLPAI
ncbi:hypothetical protein [Sphingomonas sp.]|uniref:hypothetical protein n=1 Tax=Sphingomonas sp. TaxID=28214 RepID=UPI001B2B1968|nr:hypothetical protein [Sphingomonas sp.]MBO9714200.1 hypothetical protein [Sphingomonas sp.]